MWRRSYLLLLLVRLYFAVSPSYIHPDENFQGPEVIAGEWMYADFGLYPSQIALCIPDQSAQAEASDELRLTA